MVFEKQGINILKERVYSKLLTIIAIGYGNVADIRDIRTETEGRYSLSKTLISIQLSNLCNGVYINDNYKDDKKQLKTEIITEDSIKRYRNIKKWIIKEGQLGLLFINYIKQIYDVLTINSKKNDDIIDKELKKSDVFDYKTIQKRIEKNFPNKRLNRETSIFSNPSMRFKLFIEDIIIKYLKYKFLTHRADVLEETFEQHFKQASLLLVRALDMNDSSIREKLLIGGNYKNKQFDFSDPIHSEMYYFFNVLKKTLQTNDILAQEFMYKIELYLGGKAEN
jgi:hypothetical protein